MKYTVSRIIDTKHNCVLYNDGSQTSMTLLKSIHFVVTLQLP